MSEVLRSFEKLDEEISGVDTGIKVMSSYKERLVQSKVDLIVDLYAKIIEPAAKETGYEVAVEGNDFTALKGVTSFEDFRETYLIHFVKHFAAAGFPGPLDFRFSKEAQEGNLIVRFVYRSFATKKPKISVTPRRKWSYGTYYLPDESGKPGNYVGWEVDNNSPVESLVSLIQKYEKEILPRIKEMNAREEELKQHAEMKHAASIQ